MKQRSSFFVNGLLLTAVAVLARSVSLFFTAYVTSSVGKAGIGLYTLLMTVYGFALTFATAGISLTVTRLVAAALGEGNRHGVRRVLRASLLYATAFGAAAFAALFLLAPWLAERVLGRADMTWPLRVLSLSLLPEACSAVFGGYFVGVRRVVGNAAAQIATQGFKILVTCAFIGRVSAYGAVSACLFLAAVSFETDFLGFLFQGARFLLDRHGCAERAPDITAHTGAMRAVAGMALPLGLSAYIRSALLTVEHALIPLCLRMRGESATEALASYGLLHAMTLPILLFPIAALTSFSSLLVPEFAEARAAGQKTRLSRITSRAVRATLMYAIAVALLMTVFAEELGFCLYGSYEVGYYLSRMAWILPLMYLDHVTDAMLKGIGEQVYSMWVNISDACLSVILVRVLIPRMGIGGYALVIILMEGFNFALSFLRLRRRISFSVRPLSSFALTAVAALLAAYLSRHLFSMNGAGTTPLWLWMKLLFSLCVFIGVWLLLTQVIPFGRHRRKGVACGTRSHSGIERKSMSGFVKNAETDEKKDVKQPKTYCSLQK